MTYSEGSLGRVFVLRLEHGDCMPRTLEEFAKEKQVASGIAIMVGGIDDGSGVVVGPRDGNALPVDPVLQHLVGAHEVAAVGVLVPDETGAPMVHMHAALGRAGHTVTGCIRPGVRTWRTAEVVLIEMVGIDAARLPDAETGFKMLQCFGGRGADEA